MSELTLHGKLFLGPYEGYHGEASYDPDDESFSGYVVDTKDVITFEGDTAKELKSAFIASVDAYLEFCKERGEAPEKPFSGKFNIRITPELHHSLTILATQSGESLNQYITNALTAITHRKQATPISVSTSGMVPVVFQPGTSIASISGEHYTFDMPDVGALAGLIKIPELGSYGNYEATGALTTTTTKIKNVPLAGGRLSDVKFNLPAVRRTGTSG